MHVANEETTTTVICDNPNCDTVHILLATDNDAPLGYYLSGSGHLSFGGGPIPGGCTSNY